MPILFLFLLAHLVELMVLIEVGSEIGGFTTLVLCLCTASLGLILVRQQGLGVLGDLQNQDPTNNPSAIGSALVHGFFLLVAGAFLMIPGFVSDFLGVLLLFPPVRRALGARGLARVYTVHRSGTGGRADADQPIDGDYVDLSDQGADPSRFLDTDNNATLSDNNERKP